MISQMIFKHNFMELQWILRNVLSSQPIKTGDIIVQQHFDLLKGNSPRTQYSQLGKPKKML